MKSSYILFFVILCLSGCHDKTNPAPVTSTGDVLIQYGTPFAAVPAPEDAYIYQVNIRAFGPNGDFAGVVDRLDSIKSLGVNVVYLMPVNPVGVLKSVNSPYCVKDYTAINAEFGDLSGLRAIVDGAHSRNMAVMMDWVANHTSWDNAWITAHPTWYLQDANGTILSPPNTNYTDVAQLNFNNADMRLEMIKDMKYWVYTANVDGFRCDFADNPPSTFWTQAIDTLRKISTHELLLLGEGSRSANYSSGFDYNFGFSFYGQMKSIFGSAQAVTTIDGLNTTDYSGATGSQQIVRYLNNHDVNGSDGTPLTLFGGQNGSIAAFVVTSLMKGVPMIYNGQEVGFPTQIVFPFTSVKINWNSNFGILKLYKKIIAFRNSSTAVRTGALVSYSNADVSAFTKVLGSDSVLVISNLRNAAKSVTIPASITKTPWKDAFNNNAPVTVSATVQLNPYQYMILTK